MTFLSRLSSRRNTAEKITPPVIVKPPEVRSRHLDLLASEVATRVLLVSDSDCARLLRLCFDEYGQNCLMHTSEGGITTITGTIQQKPVSIVSIGNGMAAMDKAVRELRDLTKGPLAIIHLAKCSTHIADVATGSTVVAVDSFAVQTLLGSEPAAFKISQPIRADSALVQLLASQLEREKKCTMIQAGDITTDTFYAAQGRQPAGLNHQFFADLVHNHPKAMSLQMQTYPLYRLAHQNGIHAAACAIVINNLATDQFLEVQTTHEIELAAGHACMQALSHINLGTPI